MESTRVTFKDEGSINDGTVGPVHVFDMDVYNADPKVRESAVGVPYGYVPQGRTDLGWMRRSDAEATAAAHGVLLEEL